MINRIKEWLSRLFKRKPYPPKPKHFDLPIREPKKKVLNLPKKKSYCFRCPWGTLHRGNRVYVECRKRGRIYGARKLERGNVHCHEEARIRAGKIIVEAKNG